MVRVAAPCHKLRPFRRHGLLDGSMVITTTSVYKAVRLGEFNPWAGEDDAEDDEGGVEDWAAPPPPGQDFEFTPPPPHASLLGTQRRAVEDDDDDDDDDLEEEDDDESPENMDSGWLEMQLSK